MKIIKGDLIKLAIKGEFDVIIHGCNCFCTMGAGIAKQIKENFPEAYIKDTQTVKGDKTKLGSYTWVKAEDYKIIIVNAYTQYHYSGLGVLVDYEAIKLIFRSIKKEFKGLKIGYPAIGAGLAGGNWKKISDIINQELKGENHTFVEFDG